MLGGAADNFRSRALELTLCAVGVTGVLIKRIG